MTNPEVKTCRNCRNNEICGEFANCINGSLTNWQPIAVKESECYTNCAKCKHKKKSGECKINWSRTADGMNCRDYKPVSKEIEEEKEYIFNAMNKHKGLDIQLNHLESLIRSDERERITKEHIRDNGKVYQQGVKDGINKAIKEVEKFYAPIGIGCFKVELIRKLKEGK